MSQSHSSAPWSSAAEHHQPHSAYAATAGPSSYRAHYSHNSAPHHTYYQFQQHAEPWSRQSGGSTASPPERDQSVVHSTHVAADGTTVYAATGRKRKRLQKACVACHKAKRRCDGGLPCSNCDFSGRTCCYSDASGKMVIPTARVENKVSPPAEIRPAPLSAPLPTALPLLQPNHAFPSSTSLDQQSRARSGTFSSQSTSPKLPGVPSQFNALLTIDDVAPERRREMISIFFSQLHPFSCVVDEITFLRDLSASEVPSWLLMSMFALSARFQQGGSEMERERRFLNGERYARAARAALQQEDQDGSTLLDRPDVDAVLALCFLAAHEFGMGRLHRALSYSNNAVRTVATLRLADGATPSSRSSQYGRDSYPSAARRATCERLVLLSWTLDMTISALAAQPSAVRCEEVSLAVASFGATRDDVRDEVTRSFVRLAEIASVFTQVLDKNRSTRQDFSSCQAALRKWAESLSVDHKFDDYNMKQASRLLEESEATAASHRAWFWAQMHLMAECCVFLMEANNSSAGAAGHSQPAYDNIQLILSILGIAGRRNLFASPALFISVEFNRPTPDVLRWWNTARQCWMMGDRQVRDAARLFVRPTAASSPRSDSLVLPRLSSSSIISAGSSNNARGSQTMSLPPLSRQTLPALRLSPSAGKPQQQQQQDRCSPRSSTVTSPGDASSTAGGGSRNVPGVDSSPSSSHSDDDDDDDDSSVLSPKSVPQDLYHSDHAPLYRNPAARTASTSPTLPPQHTFHKDPRDAWSPISSLRTPDKRVTLPNTTAVSH